MTPERRFFRSELRTEEIAGKVFLQGRAANYNVISHDLGGWRETLAPGCFDTALAAKGLDVTHNVNHDDDRILGRTTSGTLKLIPGKLGLSYRSLLPETQYADDLVELIKRRDVTQSSFSFTVDLAGQAWSEVDDPDNPGTPCSLRTITRVTGLYDVSTVTRAAYPETSAGLSRSLFPSGELPVEVRAHLLGTKRTTRAVDDACQCTCEGCLKGDCGACDDADCLDAMCATRGCANVEGDDAAADRARMLALVSAEW